MPSKLEIPQRELAALRKLGEGGVEYLLVGGQAMRYHGIDRPTADVDVVTSTDPENAARLYVAISHIIGHLPDFEAELLSKPKKEIRFQDDGLSLDILTTLPGMEFAEAFADRNLATQNGTQLFVISKPHLLRTKRTVAETDPSSTRRQKEQVDVSLLEGTSSG